jgi:hypothetical protein
MERLMHWLALGMALLLAFAIIAIGIGYLANPRAMTQSFGLPLPESGANIAWWLRLKGIRDVASGVLVLSFVGLGEARGAGLVLLVEAVIPIGDMPVILAAKGRRKTAFGIHGVTAAVMVLSAIPLMIAMR